MGHMMLRSLIIGLMVGVWSGSELQAVVVRRAQTFNRHIFGYGIMGVTAAAGSLSAAEAIFRNFDRATFCFASLCVAMFVASSIGTACSSSWNQTRHTCRWGDQTPFEESCLNTLSYGLPVGVLIGVGLVDIWR